MWFPIFQEWIRSKNFYRSERRLKERNPTEIQIPSFQSSPTRRIWIRTSRKWNWKSGTQTCKNQKGEWDLTCETIAFWRVAGLRRRTSDWCARLSFRRISTTKNWSKTTTRLKNWGLGRLLRCFLWGRSVQAQYTRWRKLTKNWSSRTIWRSISGQKNTCSRRSTIPLSSKDTFFYRISRICSSSWICVRVAISRSM